MSNTIIEVNNLSKSYIIAHEGKERYTALRDVMAQKAKKLFSFPKSMTVNSSGSKEEFWALKDVSFKIEQGDRVGIIGRNGAGKSTLLKILSRITEPTAGEIKIKGRVASLLEVGTGFHPELTGRENIFLNGAILGMSRAEIRKHFDAIVDFAEVEKFLDTPVKRYSSGMYVRLAFAVAAHLEPEILVVDEVLAVGDAEFQKKCLGKMEDVSKNEGRTVLFVSHNIPTIRQLCNRAIHIANGQIFADGASNQIVENYLKVDTLEDSLNNVRSKISSLPKDSVFRLLEVDIMQDGVSTTNLSNGKAVQIFVEYEVSKTTSGLHVCLVLNDVDETMIFDSLHNGDLPDIPVVVAGRYKSEATIQPDFLAGRTYFLRIYAAIHSVRECVPVSAINIKLEVSALGLVNRAYPGYTSPGKIAPLIKWETKKL